MPRLVRKDRKHRLFNWPGGIVASPETGKGFTSAYKLKLESTW